MISVKGVGLIHAESILHVLRDCVKSRRILIILMVSPHSIFFFSSILWHIWKGRNDVVFNGKNFDVHTVCFLSKKFAREASCALT